MLTRSGIDNTLPPDNKEKSWRVGAQVERKSTTLNEILEEHNSPTRIDYLSIDIEGGEVNALKNFDFEKYFIRVISAEVSYVNRTDFRKIMSANNFMEVENSHCSVSYELFFVNQNRS